MYYIGNQRSFYRYVVKGHLFKVIDILISYFGRRRPVVKGHLFKVIDIHAAERLGEYQL